MIQFIQMFR